MFGQLFGEFLTKKSIITISQFEEVCKLQNSTQVKLGFIAVSEKLLTREQADDINHLQTTMDKRFGDIAVEKGYLSDADVHHLLNIQGNSYFGFVQSIINLGFLSLEEVEEHLNTYKKENNFSNSDMEAIKSGDIDRILPIFVSVQSPNYMNLIGLALRNIIRFIDNHIRIEKGYYTKEYQFEHFVYQTMNGKHQVISGFASKDNGLLTIANPFAKETFDQIDEDSIDAVAEFINCINGLFAAKLSNEDIEIDMLPPLSSSNAAIKTTDELYVIPIFIQNKQVDFIVAIDQTYDFIK